MMKADSRELLRVATYNVHGCVGKGGLQPERIADVVGALGCDVVALQEIDVHRPRSGAVDQLTLIAKKLGYQAIFGPAWERHGSGAYGNALLSKWPIIESSTIALPEQMGLRCEPRSLMEARIESANGEVVIWNTHLGVRGREREAQGRALIQRAQETLRGGKAPLVLMGDLNAGPAAGFIRNLGLLLADARASLRRRAPTYPAWWPVLALDHVLVSRPLEIVDLRTDRSPLGAIASDHLALAATLKWAA